MMKKKAMSVGVSMVFIIMMLLATFLVWKFGILDRLIGVMGSVSYQIDTTHMDICQGIGEKRRGGISTSGQELTDMDGDELPDYICDTCICRDGYGVRGNDEISKCAIFKTAYDTDTLADGIANEFLGLYEYSVSGSPDPPQARCYHKNGLISENNFCSTNNLNIEVSDTDNDFLPDICDRDPDNFNQGRSLKCYEGPITSNDVILGVVFAKQLENGLMDDTYQCVFAVCSPLNNRLIDNSLYQKYCPNSKCNEPDKGSIFENKIYTDVLTGKDTRFCYCFGKSDAHKDEFVVCDDRTCDNSGDKPKCKK